MKAWRWLAGCGAAFLVGAAVATWLWWDMRASLEAPLPVREVRTFTVTPGQSMRRIAERLHQEGLLDNPWYLPFEARRLGVATRIQAGEYAIRPGSTPIGLLQAMVAGRVVQHAITLLEGWRFAEVRRALAGAPALEHTIEGLSDEQVMAALGHPGQSPEGRFFPDTYYFPRGTTDLQVLQRAYRVMAERLAALWAQRDPDLPYSSPDEALILASIVEKETGVAAERERIAGVLVRRLRKGMRLQADPTVIFALGARFDGNIRRRDLATDSPWNTYRHAGLPPTPIALPGEASLRAALHPANDDALYFVGKGDGTHHFSASLAEHNRAVARYQLGRGSKR